MKIKFHSILLLILVFLPNLSAQDAKDSLFLYEYRVFVYPNYTLIRSGRFYNSGNIPYFIKQDPESYRIFRAARQKYHESNLLVMSGITVIALSNYIAIHDEIPQVFLGNILGAGLIAWSIPFRNKYNKYTKLGVKTYNTNLTRRNREVSLNIQTNNIGITFKF